MVSHSALERRFLPPPEIGGVPFKGLVVPNQDSEAGPLDMAIERYSKSSPPPPDIVVFTKFTPT